jgi:asparagine synthase (glutamine-hydrolysing)
MVAAAVYGADGYDPVEAYLATYHRFYGLTDRLYTPAMRAATQTLDAAGWVRPALEAPGFCSLLHRLRAANLALKGAQNIAPRAAQLAAAYGLRLRMPFFDRALAEWTFTLPPEAFLRGACEKYLLKRAAETYLPPEIVWRDKRGMGVPTTDWCLGPLRGEVRRRLSPARLRRDNRFDPAFVAALLRGEDGAGEFRRRRLGERLWALLMLHVWWDAHGEAT